MPTTTTTPCGCACCEGTVQSTCNCPSGGCAASLWQSCTRKVSISGFADGACQCSALNGDWFLLPGTVSGTCAYVLSIGGTFNMQLWGDSGGTGLWRLDLTTPDGCTLTYTGPSAFGDLFAASQAPCKGGSVTLSYSSGGGSCSAHPGTITVSAPDNAACGCGSFGCSGGTCLPKTLHVAITNRNGCACLDGLTLALTAVGSGAFPGSCQSWQGTTSATCGGFPVTVTVILNYPSGGANWQAELYCNSALFAGFASQSVPSQDCSAFSLSFASLFPFTGTFGQGCCTGTATDTVDLLFTL